MQIFIRHQDETSTLEVDGSTTLGQIKESLNFDGIFSYGGAILDQSEATLTALEIPNLATLDVTGRLLGGKVHGSLARAGKVKGQTPKVDKQEKKKKKTGRAKRRIQYNRRFVNVISGPGGRRKGPNSNAA